MPETINKRVERLENTLAELFNSIESLQQDYDRNRGVVQRSLDSVKGDYRKLLVRQSSHEANAHRRKFKDATR